MINYYPCQNTPGKILVHEDIKELRLNQQFSIQICFSILFFSVVFKQCIFFSLNFFQFYSIKKGSMQIINQGASFLFSFQGFESRYTHIYIYIYISELCPAIYKLEAFLAYIHQYIYINVIKQSLCIYIYIHHAALNTLNTMAWVQ